MQPETTQVIQEVVAPAVMIPASALLLLSSTARMNVVLARIRTFHREQLDVWCQDPAEGSRHAAVRETRLEGLEHQVDRLLRRARLLRMTMLLLFGAITCNLPSVLALAAHYVLTDPQVVYRLSVYLFLVGIALILVAMVTSVLEVGRILETLRYEHRRVARLMSNPPDGSRPSAMTGDGESMGL
jgi:hypothetical protein